MSIPSALVRDVSIEDVQDLYLLLRDGGKAATTAVAGERFEVYERDEVRGTKNFENFYASLLKVMKDVRRVDAKRKNGRLTRHESYSILDSRSRNFHQYRISGSDSSGPTLGETIGALADHYLGLELSEGELETLLVNARSSAIDNANRLGIRKINEKDLYVRVATAQTIAASLVEKFVDAELERVSSRNRIQLNLYREYFREKRGRGDIYNYSIMKPAHRLTDDDFHTSFAEASALYYESDIYFNVVDMESGNPDRMHIRLGHRDDAEEHLKESLRARIYSHLYKMGRSAKDYKIVRGGIFRDKRPDDMSTLAAGGGFGGYAGHLSAGAFSLSPLWAVGATVAGGAAAAGLGISYFVNHTGVGTRLKKWVGRGLRRVKDILY